MNNKCNETLNIRIERDLLDNLRNISKSKNIPYSQLIREILKEYCKKVGDK